MPAVPALSRRATQVAISFRRLGLRATARMAFCRATACSLTRFWLRPPSPASMIFSSSAITGSGVLLLTGKIPTDWPCIQSASKSCTVSTAAWRSAAFPWMTRRLRDGSARTMPGFAAKLSSSFVNVVAETNCSGTTVMPYPGSGPCALSIVPVPAASAAGKSRYELPSRTSATLLTRKAFSST